jgi:hypothetical protein
MNNILKQTISFRDIPHISSITINSGDAVGRYKGLEYLYFLQNTLTLSLICSAAMMLYP